MGTGRVAFVAGMALVSVVGTPAPAGSEQPTGSLPIRIGSPSYREAVIVVEGDHLWKISQDHLDSALDRRSTNEEVSPYWRRVIDENRGRLRSGDPNLIYPGETVVLPPTVIAPP